LNSIKVKDRGVFVQASTLGSLEALLEFLKTSKIPVYTLSSSKFYRKLNLDNETADSLFRLDPEVMHLNHRHLSNKDCFTAHTASLVSLISMVNGCSKKKERKPI
jgi:hypothetical protein